MHGARALGLMESVIHPVIFAVEMVISPFQSQLPPVADAKAEVKSTTKYLKKTVSAADVMVQAGQANYRCIKIPG